jgi:hypothetical protein
MSTEPRTLGWYVASLIAALDAADPQAANRLRHVTSDRTATIALDDAAVRVTFVDRRLVVVDETAGAARTPCGRTDSATVVALLDGRLELHAAIVDGRIDIVGSDEDVARMLCAVEILLDAAPRAPALQRLAAEFRRDHPPRGAERSDWLSWYPFRPTTSEWRLLQTLDTLP